MSIWWDSNICCISLASLGYAMRERWVERTVPPFFNRESLTQLSRSCCVGDIRRIYSASRVDEGRYNLP